MSQQSQPPRYFHGGGGGGRGRGGYPRPPKGGNFCNPAQGPGILPIPPLFMRPPCHPGNQMPMNQNFQDWGMPPRDACYTSSQQSLNDLDGPGRGGRLHRGRGNRGNYRGRNMSRGSSMSDLSGDNWQCNQGEYRSHDQAEDLPRNQSQSKQNGGGSNRKGRNGNKNMQNDDNGRNKANENNKSNENMRQSDNRNSRPDTGCRGRGNQGRRGSCSRGGSNSENNESMRQSDSRSMSPGSAGSRGRGNHSSRGSGSRGGRNQANESNNESNENMRQSDYRSKSPGSAGSRGRGNHSSRGSGSRGGRNQANESYNESNESMRQSDYRSMSPDRGSRGRGNQSRRGNGSRSGRGQGNSSVDSGRDRHPSVRDRMGTDYTPRQGGPFQTGFEPHYRPGFPRGPPYPQPSNFQGGRYGPIPTGMPGPHRFTRPPNPSFFHPDTVPPEGLETFFNDTFASQNEYLFNGNRRGSGRGGKFGSERSFRGGFRGSSTGGGRRPRRGRSGYPVYKQHVKETQETESDASDITELSDVSAGKDDVHVPKTNTRKKRRSRGRPGHRRGGWSMYANRYNNHIQDNTSNVDTEDSFSQCETISVRSSSPMSVTSEILEDGNLVKGTKQEKVNADDIKDVSALTLTNRIKRYQRKITTLKCQDTNEQDEINHLNGVISKIKEELAQRRQQVKKKEKENQNTVSNTSQVIESTNNDVEDNDNDDKVSGKDTAVIKPAKSNMPLKKMHTKVLAKKGGVSFRPMSKVALKQARIRCVSDATGKGKSSTEEQTSKTAEIGNENSKEAVDDKDMPEMENSTSDNQAKKKKRNRNRKKVKQEEPVEENDDQLQELERLLDGLDVVNEVEHSVEPNKQPPVKDHMEDTGNLPPTKPVNSTPPTNNRQNGRQGTGTPVDTERGKQDIHAREKNPAETTRGRQGKGAREKNPVDTVMGKQDIHTRETTPADTARGRQGQSAREKTPVYTARRARTPVDSKRERQDILTKEKTQADTERGRQGKTAREKTPVDMGRGRQDIHTRETTPVDVARGREGKDTRERRESGNQLNEPNVNEVFKFMVKEMNGRGSVEDIVSKSGLFPQNFDKSMQEKWFKSNSSRFTLLWRDENLQYVYVLKRECKTCLDYSSSRGCSKTDCRFYHVCKDFLSGFCRYTANKCRFSHDLFDEYNMKLVKEMGYSRVFNTTEILAVLRARFPHVCAAWNKGSCYDDVCVKLHLCRRYVYGECLEGDDCMFSHDHLNHHNKPIVDAYQLGHWNGGLFRKMIIIEKEAPQEVIKTATEEQRAARPKVKPSSRANRVFDPLHNIPRERRYSAENRIEQVIQREVAEAEVEAAATDIFEEVSYKWQQDDQEVVVEDIKVSERLEERRVPRRQPQKKIVHVAETGISDNTTICDLDLVGKCNHQGCSSFHNNRTRVPYLWQVELFGSWEPIADAEEKIERPYCAKKHQSEEVLVWGNYVIIEFHDPKLSCRFSIEDSFESVRARRISTISYTQSNNSTDTADSFKTQWRWYWQDDVNSWQSYEDTMQYTLETKYLAGQKKYMFTRENYRFKYFIDFNTMMQLNLDTHKSRRMIRRPILVKAASVLRGILPEKLRPPPPIEVPLPEGWVPWDHTNEFELVELSSQSRIYKEVERKFFKTVSQNREEITCIYRVQSHANWSSFCTKERNMTATLERTNPGAVLEKHDLFHGTDNLDTVRGICTHNFDPRVSGKNATVYGEGAYFARDAKYSHSYTKAPDRFVFLAHVLVGQYTRGNREYKRPPLLPGSRLDLYDSCVDNMDNPSIFILFERSQHYPAYLIQYKDKDQYTDYTEAWANNPSASRNTSSRPTRVTTPSTHATVGSAYTHHRSPSPPPPPRASRHMPATPSPSSSTSGPSYNTRPTNPSPKKDSSCCVQ